MVFKKLIILADVMKGKLVGCDVLKVRCRLKIYPQRKIRISSADIGVPSQDGAIKNVFGLGLFVQKALAESPESRRHTERHCIQPGLETVLDAR